VKKQVGILGIGSYVPEKVVTNYDLMKTMDTSHEWIIERTGISTRHIAAEGEYTSDLAVKAAERALADAGVKAEELDLIIVGTATPDMPFPATACLVQEKLGARKVAAFDLTAACAGFMYGVVIGSKFIETGFYKKVLVIGAETLSRIVDWEDRNTAILFADGAGAVVLGESEESGILGTCLGADGSCGDLLKVPGGGSCAPTSLETVQNRMHYIKMDGNSIFKIAVKTMGEAAKVALDNAGLTYDDISYMIPHQANIRIIQAMAKRLNMPMDRVIVNLDKYGNTSAATIPIALDEAVKSGVIKKGDIVLTVTFGGGLTWGAGIIKWLK
jgi:3-oxoacyl-[acyl-carrier-protein] synthase-3